MIQFSAPASSGHASGQVRKMTYVTQPEVDSPAKVEPSQGRSVSDDLMYPQDALKLSSQIDSPARRQIEALTAQKKITLTRVSQPGETEETVLSVGEKLISACGD